ncbi:hypothetical protein LXA43DRAFT_1068666 [Ganoderma leucocontextum]|nr:hypothetical protein LXA43DRAFT_1068666 [Ganoderma leucocontextum]
MAQKSPKDGAKKGPRNGRRKAGSATTPGGVSAISTPTRVMSRRIRMTLRASESGYSFLRNGPVDGPGNEGGYDNDPSTQRKVNDGVEMIDGGHGAPSLAAGVALPSIAESYQEDTDDVHGLDGGLYSVDGPFSTIASSFPPYMADVAMPPPRIPIVTSSSSTLSAALREPSPVPSPTSDSGVAASYVHSVESRRSGAVSAMTHDVEVFAPRQSHAEPPKAFDKAPESREDEPSSIPPSIEYAEPSGGNDIASFMHILRCFEALVRFSGEPRDSLVNWWMEYYAESKRYKVYWDSRIDDELARIGRTTAAHPLPNGDRTARREGAWDNIVDKLRSTLVHHCKEFGFEAVVIAGSAMEAASSQIVPIHFETSGATGEISQSQETHPRADAELERLVGHPGANTTQTLPGMKTVADAIVVKTEPTDGTGEKEALSRPADYRDQSVPPGIALESVIHPDDEYAFISNEVQRLFAAVGGMTFGTKEKSWPGNRWPFLMALQGIICKCWPAEDVPWIGLFEEVNPVITVHLESSRKSQ